MGLSKIKLGKYLELYSEKCGISNLSNEDVSGVNKDKEFFEPSNQVGCDTSKYKIVPPRYFACNLMHVGRDVVLPIAFNHSKNNKIVSPAYHVFNFIDNNEISSEYFFLLLKSSERDRYFWFNTDGSVRDGMSWEDFIDIDIDLPPLSIQQKYVDVYNAMVANQQSYERGLEDLKLVCDAYIEKLKRTVKNIPIKEYVNKIDNRNHLNKKFKFMGLSMENYFIESIADSNEIDFSKYKIVAPGEFGAVLMKVGRDGRLTIARNECENHYLISPAYFTFSIKEINPDYFMAVVSRSEFGRRAWFSCDSSARGSLSWHDFLNLEIPSVIKSQQSIVGDLYRVILNRNIINEKLKAQIKAICPILIKGSIEEGRKTKEV